MFSTSYRSVTSLEHSFLNPYDFILKENDKTGIFHKFSKCDHFVPHANCKRKIILSLLLASVKHHISAEILFVPPFFSTISRQSIFLSPNTKAYEMSLLFQGIVFLALHILFKVCIDQSPFKILISCSIPNPVHNFGN